MKQIPTLQQLITSSLTKLEDEYGVTISLVKKVALRAIATVWGAGFWLLYKTLGFVQKNVWVDTADPESKGGTLERFGRIRLNREPYAAVSGQYSITVTGSIGATIPAQQTFKSDDSALSPGFIFILDSIHTMITTSDTITLRALTAGIESKLAIGNTLTSTSPIPLINNPVTVTAITEQPLAAETIEDYRSVTTQSFQLESQGMSAGDIRIWSNDASGVAKVYPYTKSGDSNSFDVFVEANIIDSTDGKGTPGALILADVEAVINFKPNTTLPVNETGRRSINAIAYVQAITPKNIDITIDGGGFSTTQQTLITNALESFVGLVRPYVAAAEPVLLKNSVLSENNINGVIYAQVPGANYNGVDLEVASVVVASYEFFNGDIPYLNSVTFT
jgi:hypothetical protein